MAHFGDYQTEIYLGGTPPALPIGVDDLTAAAAEVMTPEAFGYVAGSAGMERTARANLEAFERWLGCIHFLGQVTQ